MKRLVTGILAHVDSGKTTLSEALLYLSGAVRKPGRVDHGDTFLDNYSLERSRGITIFSKQASVRYGDTELILLDTPGHADFSAEMERTMQVLDYAVLVISGTDGVQSHTETLWRLLVRYNIPVFIFVNKMDLAGADKNAVISQLKSRLDYRCVDFSCTDSDDFFEELAECDEEIMQSVLESGRADDDNIRHAVKHRRVFPCCFGSALKMYGVEELLTLIDRYALEPERRKEFGAKVFKISEDEQGNRLTHMKITGGSLKVRSALSGNGWSEKVNQIRIYSGAKFSAAEEAFSGMICAVTGLSKTFPGEGIGAEPDSETPVLEPVLSYCVSLPEGTDPHTALVKLRKLEEEDPQLRVVWSERLREIHVQLMGEIQLEVLRSIISQRFQMDVEFDEGSIAYKETIAGKVEGVGHYEPLRHYAEVHLILEPLERGKGMQFCTDCREECLDKNWQRLVLTHLEEKTHIGVLTGSPVTDIKITLAAGRAHIKHTEGGDFRQATYRAVRQGLRSAQSILLEPWYSFKLEVPMETVGRAMSDLQQMNADFEPPETVGDISVIKGSAPVALMRGYQTDINVYTHGKGRLVCSLKGYESCRSAQEVIDRIGYNIDSDIENSADSIFCSHGSGYVVKWNEVPVHMHVESVLKSERESEDIQRMNVKRASDYCSRLAEDKELMEIFERTYGKINRDRNTAFRKRVKEEPVNQRIKPLPKGPEYLLVDGYNIIFSWDELKAVAKESLDLARSELVNILCNYQAFRQCNLILVFDAYKVKGNVREVEKIHNISVVYTKEAETADMYIEKVTNELGKKHRVRVATSDGMEQLIILGNGAYRVPASEFHDEVDAAQKAIREFIERNNS